MKSKTIIFSITILLLSNVFLTMKPESMETMTTKTSNEQGKIKLFVYNGCPWCNKVIAYLKKINQIDKVTLLDLSNAKNMQELKALNNGNTQAPYLLDEPKSIGMLESSDIIQYFSTRF
ncbi:glutathione S-transferase N-terminal domain-containing protein [Candidatus Babeliales bacterium]|nr:glutathione S-transferase N-terminal domain-containing protein [Candidatus Babeliales bacterium]